MSTLSDLLELGGGIASAYARSRGAKKATGTYTGGLDAARGTIQGRSANLSALNRDIYDRQTGANRTIYGTQQTTNRETLAEQQRRLQPYSDAGGESLEALREGVRPGGGLTDPFKFAMADLEKDPGYQFRLTEGQKILRRGANADLNRFSGGTLKAAQRYQQDYASQEFGKAYSREEGTFRANQDARYGRLRDVAGIGQTAVGQQNDAQGQFADRENLAGGQFADREASAGNQFGDRETANQVLTSQQLADLQIEKADAEAAGDVEKSNAISQMISTGLSLAPTVLKALGIGGAAASLLGGSAAAANIGLSTAGGAAAAQAAASSAVAANSAAGIGTGAAGGVGITAMQAIPIVGAALAAGAIWLKSQAHWEANTGVKDFENPFHEKALAPFSAEWDRAVNSGSLTREQGQAARQQYVTNWEDYVARITKWAGTSKDRNKVAAQSIKNLWDEVIYRQIQGIDRDMARLT